MDKVTIEFEVNSLPPLKNTALSIKNIKHPHYDRFKELQRIAKDKMRNTEIIQGDLGILIENYIRMGDADNTIGGIFDSLEGIVFQNDGQFTEVHYKVVSKDKIGYKIKIWLLDK